jgi:hypothetical protein
MLTTRAFCSKCEPCHRVFQKKDGLLRVGHIDLSSCVLTDLEGIVSKRIGFTVREWPDKGVVEDQEPGFERR